MARSRPFAQVDVFSSEPYRGNPVAVILDAEGIEDGQMLRIAQWTNLSETTFLLPPTTAEADYRVRIFTQTREIPFAGHPTLGSVRAWLDHGGETHGADVIVQECAAGLVELRQDGGVLSFAAPPTTRTGPIEDGYLAEIVAALGITAEKVVDHQWVDNGPGWAAVRLASAEEVLALDPDFSRLPEAKVGVVGAQPAGSAHNFEVRAFAPGSNVAEDPVTGSLNASLAQWLIRTGQAPEHYTATQGTRLGRAGEITVTVDDTGRVWIGGRATVLFRGTALA